MSSCRNLALNVATFDIESGVAKTITGPKSWLRIIMRQHSHLRSNVEKISFGNDFLPHADH
jgi:hypothetical protein